MGELVVKPSNDVLTTNDVTIPLGTAGWLEFPKGVRPDFHDGDFWLSRLPTGEPVGVQDDRHVLLVAGNRSGKGASYIIPNLCRWEGSAFVVDPKGENAMVTARVRANGSRYAWGRRQKTQIIDPYREVQTNEDNFNDLRGRYNPLDEIGEKKRESVDTANRIADALIVSEERGEAFWDDSARTALRTIILHVASAMSPSARNLVTVRRLILEGDRELQVLFELNGDKQKSGLGSLFEAMKANPAFGGVVAQGGAMLADLLAMSDRTLGSIMQVVRTNTDFLDSPEIQSVVTRSTFKLEDLKRTDMTVYLCMPQRNATQNYRYLRMMTTLTLAAMERTRAKPPSGRQLLMVLDEFPSLKRMHSVENAAAQIAGYGVKMMFVAQTLAQLREVYKDNWETFVANAGIKLFFGNDDNFTREYVSKLIGEREVSRWTKSVTHTEGSSRTDTRGGNSGTSISLASGSSHSVSSGPQGMSSSHGSSSTITYGQSSGSSWSAADGTSRASSHGSTETLHKRLLLTPDEVGRLFGDRSRPMALALLSGMQPLLLKRTPYFNDLMFKEMFDPHPDHPLPPTREEVRLEIEAKKLGAERAAQRLSAERLAAETRALEERRLAATLAAEARTRSLALAAERASQAADARERQLHRRVWRGVVAVVMFPVVAVGAVSDAANAVSETVEEVVDSTLERAGAAIAAIPTAIVDSVGVVIEAVGEACRLSLKLLRGTAWGVVKAAWWAIRAAWWVIKAPWRVVRLVWDFVGDCQEFRVRRAG